jgi:hypothetical protein
MPCRSSAPRSRGSTGQMPGHQSRPRSASCGEDHPSVCDQYVIRTMSWDYCRVPLKAQTRSAPAQPPFPGAAVSSAWSAERDDRPWSADLNGQKPPAPQWQPVLQVNSTRLPLPIWFGSRGLRGVHPRRDHRRRSGSVMSSHIMLQEAAHHQATDLRLKTLAAEGWPAGRAAQTEHGPAP